MDAVDRRALLKRIDAINVLVRSHAGEVELVDISPAGVVKIRYTGMCAGCDYRPLTTLGTVEPAILDVPGVKAVKVTGAHISTEASARVNETLGMSGAGVRSVRVVRRIELESQGKSQ